MKLFAKSMLKYELIKNRWNRQKQKRLHFPVTLKVPFLALTQITLNFKCYRKD